MVTCDMHIHLIYMHCIRNDISETALKVNLKSYNICNLIKLTINY